MLAIECAKNLIKNQIDQGFISFDKSSFFGYTKVYPFTNEDLKEVLELIEFRNITNALTVLASGDQTFNLICNGVLDIETFDINYLTEYFVLGLKRAMILKYSYEEFKSMYARILSSDDLDEIAEIINGLIPFMDDIYKTFWKEINDFNYSYQKENNTSLSLIKMLTREPNNLGFIVVNPYLECSDSYNRFKSNLMRSNITFKWANGVNIASSFRSKYDLIMLSNILDYAYSYWGLYWNEEKLKKFLMSLDGILSADGVVLLHYAFNYYLKKDYKFFHNSEASIKSLNGLEFYPIDRGLSETSQGQVLVRKRSISEIKL